MGTARVGASSRRLEAGPTAERHGRWRGERAAAAAGWGFAIGRRIPSVAHSQKFLALLYLLSLLTARTQLLYLATNSGYMTVDHSLHTQRPMQIRPSCVSMLQLAAELLPYTIFTAAFVNIFGTGRLNA